MIDDTSNNEPIWVDMILVEILSEFLIVEIVNIFCLRLDFHIGTTRVHSPQMNLSCRLDMSSSELYSLSSSQIKVKKTFRLVKFLT